MSENKGGKLVIFSAPSGAGKTTIVKELLQSDLNLEFSISAASRAKRNNETDGKDYYFISADEFRKKIVNDEFLEWEEVYKDHFYGTLRSEIKRIWSNGSHVIFDVDVMGGLNIKKHYDDKALAIFVMPPSVEELEIRLRKRSTESEENLKKRIEKAYHELSYARDFDKIIVNDNLVKAVKEAKDIVRTFLNSEK
jgi:guanylate kinase